MRVYANGLNINISDVVRLDFADGVNGTITNVAQLALTYEALKVMHETIGQVINQHDAKMADLRKAN